MATYVISDVHGHRKPLERVLEAIALGDDDSLYILGDMVDRGPDPVGVLRLCRSLRNTVVLMGNHENMMLDCLIGSDSTLAWYNWGINGGIVTARGLQKIPDQECDELIDWVRNLPLATRCRVGDRDYLLVHAGIRPGTYEVPEVWTDEALDAVLEAQTEEDLLWIREEFWGQPTGLVDAEGKGPIVVAGHTPTLVVDRLADVTDRTPTYGGLSRMLRLGACPETGGVPDRLAIDTGAGSVPGGGRVMALRLDDGEEFYEMIKPGE